MFKTGTAYLRFCPRVTFDWGVKLLLDPGRNHTL